MHPFEKKKQPLWKKLFDNKKQNSDDIKQNQIPLKKTFSFLEQKPLKKKLAKYKETLLPKKNLACRKSDCGENLEQETSEKKNHMKDHKKSRENKTTEKIWKKSQKKTCDIKTLKLQQDEKKTHLWPKKKTSRKTKKNSQKKKLWKKKLSEKKHF